MHNEWMEILDWITKEGFSEAARNHLKSSRPMDHDELTSEFAMMEEASTLASTGLNVFNYNLDTVYSVIMNLERDEPMEPLDYRRLGEFLEHMRKTKSALDKETWLRAIDSILEGIDFDIELEMVIKQTVSEKGDINSNASSELMKIRRNLQDTNGRIKSEITTMINSPEMGSLLQEDYFTVRDDRYVLPFKTTFKRSVKGVIHNYSKTGRTAFLEPLPLIDLNNSLSLLSAREEEEIIRILKELRLRLLDNIHYVKDLVRIATHLESLYIKNRWKSLYGCTVPEFEAGKVEVKDAWYPPVFMQLGENTVKNDFLFRENERIMVVSGPNAGGKTVSLKTFHAVCELGRRGFPVPCSKAVIPLFEDIYMVLGDQQDAIEGESSFSAHLKQLSKIAEKASENSLVLIDEIGTGTDPLQGGAISRAYLEFLKEKGCCTIVNSHLAEVKAVALEDEAFIPVAMGYDEGGDRPTYQFIYNLVGGSNALSLVKKIGFPTLFVRKLENLLLTKEESIEPLINRLKKKEQEINHKLSSISATENEIEKKEEEIEALRRKLEIKEQSFEQERLKSLKKLMDLEEAELKRRLADYDMKRARERMAAVKKEREEIEETIKHEKVKSDRTEGIPLSEVKGQVKPGETVVYDKLLKVKGILKGISGKKVEMSVSGKMMTAPMERLLVLDEKIKKKVTSARVEATARYAEKIDVRGEYGDDAIEKVENALDKAYGSGSASLTILHGHGTGALKKAIRNHLQYLQKRYAITFGPAPQDEGGDGITIVKFTR